MIENDFIGIWANCGSHYLTRRTPGTMSAALGVIHKGRPQKYSKNRPPFVRFCPHRAIPLPSLRTSSARRGGGMAQCRQKRTRGGGRFLLYFFARSSFMDERLSVRGGSKGARRAAASQWNFSPLPLPPPQKKKSSK